MIPDKREKILVADDMKLNLHVLAEVLSPEYDVMLAMDGAQALARARIEEPPDLILLDVMMPKLDGYEVVQRLKESDATRNIPVIFITALNAADDEEKGLRLGAVDYISKPFHPAIVKARIRNHLQIVRQRRLLENIAMLDGLTEIPNRRCFDEKIVREWSRAARNRVPLSLVLLDIDFFKEYNDTYGHTMGDNALKAVAETLQANVRRSADLAARYGGEEFVLILPDTDAAGARALAENVRMAVEELRIEHTTSKISPCLTISLGGSTLVPKPGQRFLPLLNTADRALYQAKDGGRNQVRWAVRDLTNVGGSGGRGTLP